MTERSADGSARSSDASGWWRLWGLAAVGHVIAHGTNPFALRGTAVAIAGLVVGLAGFAVLARPSQPAARTALVIVVPVSAWIEAPLIGNHWMLAALISLAALAGSPWRAGWSGRALPGIRLVFLVFYSFAAFAKLNAGFVDSTDSCVLVLVNQLLTQFQLPNLGAGSSAVPWIAGTVMAIELSVPFLLVVRRTRSAGVVLASLFHLALAADLVQHFYDFTLVLLPLFWLFADAGSRSRLDQEWRRWPVVRTHSLAAAVVGLILASALPLPETVWVMYVIVTWALWLVIGAALVVAVLRVWPATHRLTWRPVLLATPMVVIALVLGSAPYIGLGASTGFDMYSNLYASPAPSNHFVVPDIDPLRNGLDQPAVLLSASSELLGSYIDEDLAVSEATLLDHLARHRDVDATYEIDGVVVTVDETTDRSGLPTLSVIERKFFGFRPIPSDGSAKCQFRRRDLT